MTDPLLFEKIHEDLSYLRGRYDTDIPAIRSQLKEINSVVIDHQKKIEKIQNDMAFFRGKITVITGGISLAMVFVVEWLKSQFFGKGQ